MQTHKEGITERWLKDGAHFGIPRIYASSLPCVHLCHDENRIEVKFRVGVCRVRRVRRRVWVRVWAGLVLRDIYTYIYIYICITGIPIPRKLTAHIASSFGLNLAPVPCMCCILMHDETYKLHCMHIGQLVKWCTGAGEWFIQSGWYHWGYHCLRCDHNSNEASHQQPTPENMHVNCLTIP